MKLTSISLITTVFTAASVSANNEHMIELANVQDEATKTLKQHSLGMNDLSGFEEKFEEITREIQRLQEVEERLAERTKTLEDVLHQINAKHVEDFAKKLNETFLMESRRREKLIAIVKDSEAAATAAVTDVEDLSRAVKLHDLDGVLEGQSIVQDTERALETWVNTLVETEVAEASKQREASKAQVTAKEPEACMTPMEAAHLVEASLIKHDNDAVGLVDYTKGATVVHQMTSPSFVPPPEYDEYLGTVWWNKYVPQDIERMLPPGWEDWNVAVPSFVSRVFGMRGSTLPPEAVLDANVYPGACWPMEGSSGHITLRLQKPIASVTGITYDHAPKVLMQRLEAGASAPKNVRVIGYPPCDDGCKGLGFDTAKGVVLTTFRFDKTGRSKQTFEVESSSEGGCEASASVEATSCGADLNTFQQQKPTGGSPIAAVKFEILDNYGDGKYTCLYRLRVHGEAE